MVVMLGVWIGFSISCSRQKTPGTAVKDTGQRQQLSASKVITAGKQKFVLQTTDGVTRTFVLSPMPPVTGGDQPPTNGVTAAALMQSKIDNDRGTPRSLFEIVTAIRNASNEAERQRALSSLSHAGPLLSGNPALADWLLDSLRNKQDYDVMLATQQALGGASDNSIPFLAALRYNDATDAAEQERLLGVLRHVQDAAAVPLLIGLADTASGQYNDPLALAAVDTLGVIGSTEAIKDLLGRIETASAQQQDVQPLVDALARTINPAVFPLLSSIASGEEAASQAAQLAALRALGHYPTAESRQTLNQVLTQTTDAEIHAAAAAALQRANLNIPTDLSKLSP